VEDGKVLRMSGDYLPVSPGRTALWLWTSLGIAAVSILFFVLAPLGGLAAWLYKKQAPAHNRFRQISTFLTLSGTALVINNALLLIRILQNNYRSFAELKIHVILNYPLTALAAVFLVLTALFWRKDGPTRGQKRFALLTAAILLGFIAVLLNWQFFRAVA